jgi:eukaryotic-like serine/threonine-protein kinase
VQTPELRLPLLPGDRIDLYEVVAEVGHGGMAAVYAARKSGPGGFDKLLALKILLPHLATDEQVSRTVLDEARIAACIHHPNVVEVFDVGSICDVPYIAMEFLRGRSLSAALRKGGISRGAILHLLAQAASGLGAAHRACALDGNPLGVIHRDVSPQNIHVGYNGVAKLVDFGIASARGRLAETRSDVVKGKLGYLAPEQILRNQPIGPGVDIWAFGVVAWEALAGRRLFYTSDEGSTLWRVLNEPITPPPDIPKSVSRIVMACLERDPAARLADAREIARELSVAALAEGVHTIEDVAAEVQRLFAVEQAVEQERLKTALGSEPRQIREPEPASSFVMPLGPSKRPKRALWIALGASAFVTLAAAVMLALSSGAGRPVESDAAARRSASEPRWSDSAQAAPAPSATASVAVSVNSAAPPLPPAPASTATQRPRPQRPPARPPTPAEEPARVGPLQKSPYLR